MANWSLTIPSPNQEHYVIAIPASDDAAGQVTITMIVDKTFIDPGDLRKLGALILRS